MEVILGAQVWTAYQITETAIPLKITQNRTNFQ